MGYIVLTQFHNIKGAIVCKVSPSVWLVRHS